jgi:2'-5' RNA ligase
MRLFVAADISDETRAQIRSVRDALEPLIAGRRAPRITWVHESAAHVTVRFIGEVSDQQAAAIAAVLTPALVTVPFEVCWDRVGTFPGGRSPRVIWLSATRGAESLAELAALVGTRLESVIAGGDTRPFKAHLTIGRVRDPGRVAWAAALARVTIEPTITRVDHVTLYRSQLSPKGPTYTELVKTALQPSLK